MTHPYTRLFTLPAPPDADNDVTEGYELGDVVHVTGGGVYDCRDATEGAAVWEERAAGGSFDGDVLGQFKLSGFENLALSSDENDWALPNFATKTVYRITLSGNCEITGIAGGTEGKIIVLMNLETNTDQIALLNNNVNSLAANRFAFGQNMGLTSGQSIILIYDGTANRWHRLGNERTYAELQTIIYATIGNEYVQDIAGDMVSSNTETGISVTYDDGSGKLNFDAQTAGDTRYAPIAKGVTNGDGHDHNGGDGAQISFLNLSNSFNDSEGNPANLGTAADGTSTYPARRDHVHAIPNYLIPLPAQGLSGTIAAATAMFTPPFYYGLQTAAFNFVVKRAGTLRNLSLTTNSAQPGTGTLVATVRKNGADTALTVTIAAGGAAQTQTDAANTVSVVAGDLISIRIVNNASSASAQIGPASLEQEIPAAY